MATPSAHQLREAIAESVWGHLSAQDVAGFCVSVGLAPAGLNEDPFSSKRAYVRGKTMELDRDQLLDLAARIATELGDEVLEAILPIKASRGVDGALKNIIFASTGYKPRIVLRDAINNVIEIVENADSCLVYDRPLLDPGLSWDDLVDWWSSKSSDEDAARALYRRLSQSLASQAERTLFRTYCERYGALSGGALPALLPQVYLHYDPYTRAQRQEQGEIRRERMDFLLLLPDQSRIVIEVDGKQHYSDSQGNASPRLYSEMVCEDRKIRLAGYEVYRFGGSELLRPSARVMVNSFFDELLQAHGLAS